MTSTSASGPAIGVVPSSRGLPPGSSPSTGNAATSAPIFLSGSVALDNGTPLPSGIAIERVCSINARTVAWADAKGHFSFQWGGLASGLPDASDSGNRSAAGMIGLSPGAGISGGGGSVGTGNGGPGSGPMSPVMNCELRARLAGYRSDVISLTSHHQTDSPDLGLIVLHRISGVDGLAVSSTALAAPRSSKSAYDKGLAALHSGHVDEALKLIERAVRIYPRYADAWVDLGRVQARLKMTEPARQAWLKAIELDAKLVGPYIELGIAAGHEKNWAETVNYLDRGLKLDPVSFPQAWYVDAMAHYYLEDYDAGESSAREAVRLDPQRRNPRAGYVLGMILAQKRDFRGAAAELRNYMQAAPHAPDIDQVKAQLAQIERIE